MSEYKPCGGAHPLPCGLDEDCAVPVDYFDAEKDSKEIWEAYANGR
jgi:hypothetical protein